jgi:hypothetical protein
MPGARQPCELQLSCGRRAESGDSEQVVGSSHQIGLQLGAEDSSFLDTAHLKRDSDRIIDAGLPVF